MHARDIIDRLASLDEATVAEPDVETEAPVETPTESPRRRSAPDPWTMPPDLEPGGEPRPKAEDATGAIESWLQATQQPIRDWDWDGNELRLLMDDGTTEVYSRGQLEEIGVFQGEMAFAESFEDEHGVGLPVSPEADWLDDNDRGLPPMPADDQEINDLAAGEEPAIHDEAAGVLDQILGRVASGAGATAEAPTEVQVIQIDGSEAAEVMGAISDVVKAILGAVGVPDDGEKDAPKKASDSASKKDKSDDKKTDKEKGEKEKSDDKEGDKKDDKEDDE